MLVIILQILLSNSPPSHFVQIVSGLQIPEKQIQIMDLYAFNIMYIS